MSQNNPERKSLLIVSFVFFLVTAGTIITSLFARGYQISFRKGPLITATGLLSVTSKPESASVYINDRLVTATNDTVNLPPGEYQVKINKDGYLPWQKTFQVKKETVFQTDAQLFRSVADLNSLSLAGAINPVSSPDGTKIIFAVASASASINNGLYIVELTDNLLLINKNIPRQLSANYPSLDWAKATFEFSPTSRQILANFSQSSTSYLINLDQPVNQKSLQDVSLRLDIIRNEWKEQEIAIIASKIDTLPNQLKTIASTVSAQEVKFNSSDNKVLYLAQTDATLPDHIIDAPPAQSTQTQTREIKQGNYYVYDIKDDTNFLIGSKDEISLIDWVPGTNNLYLVQSDEIKAVEYDATNMVTLFKGKFLPSLVSIMPDGSRLIILTTPYDSAPENLYTITIK